MAPAVRALHRSGRVLRVLRGPGPLPAGCAIPASPEGPPAGTPVGSPPLGPMGLREKGRETLLGPKSKSPHLFIHSHLLETLR